MSDCSRPMKCIRDDVMGINSESVTMEIAKLTTEIYSQYL